MTSLLTTLGSLRTHLEDSDFDTDVDVITSRGETLDSQSPMQWPRDSSGDSGTSMWYEEDDDYETLVEYEKPPPPLPTSAPPKLPKPQPARRPDSLWSGPSGQPPPPPLPVRHSTSSSHRVPGATAPSPYHYGAYPSKFTAPSSQGKTPPRPQRGPASPQTPSRTAMSPGSSRSAMSPGVGPRHADRHRAPTGFPGPHGSHSSGCRSSSGSMAHTSSSGGGLHTPSVPQPAQSPQYPDVFDSPVMARRVSSDMANAFFPVPEDLHNSSTSSKFARAPSTPDTPMVTSTFNCQVLKESFSPCPEDTSSRRPSKTFAPCTPRPPLSTSFASSSSPAMDSPSSTCSSRPGSLTPDSALPSPQGEVTHSRGVQRCDKCGKWRPRRRGPVARQADRVKGEATPRRQGGAIRSASASDLVQKMGGGSMDHSSCSASSVTSLNDSDVMEKKRYCPPPLRRGISADAGVMARLIEQARLDEPVPSGKMQEHRRLSGSSSQCAHHHSNEHVQRGSSSQDIRSDHTGGETSRHGKDQVTSKTSHYRQGMNRQFSSSKGEEVPGCKESAVNRDMRAHTHRNQGASRPCVQTVRAEPSQSHKSHQEVSGQYQSSSQHVKTPRDSQGVTRRYQPATTAHRQSRASESTSVIQGEQQRAHSGSRADRNVPSRNWRGSNTDLREEKSHYRSSDFLKQLNIPTELPPLSSVSKFGGSSKDLRGSTSSIASGKEVLNASAAGDDLFTPRRLHNGQRSRSSKDLRELSHGSLFGGSGQDDDIFGLSRSKEDVRGSRMSRCGGSSKDLTELSRDNMGASDAIFFGEGSNLRRVSRMGGSSKDITALYTGTLLGGSSKDLSGRPSDSRHHGDSGVLSSVSKFGGSSWELSRAAEGVERTKRYKASASSVDDKLDQVGLDASSGSTNDLTRSSRYRRQPRQSTSNSILDSVFGGSAKDLCERRKRLGLSCENLNDASTFGVTSGDVAQGAKSSRGNSTDELRLVRGRRGDFGGSDPNLLESSIESAANETSTRSRRGDNSDYRSVTFFDGEAKRLDAGRVHGRERDTATIQKVSVSVARTDRDHSSCRRQSRGEESRAAMSSGYPRQGLGNSTMARDRARDKTSCSSNQDGFTRDLASLPTGSRTSIFGSQWDLVQLNQSAATSTRMGGPQRTSGRFIT